MIKISIQSMDASSSSSAELRAFEATAAEGSMSAAARRLGLRQPTVSAHIASLERTFGVELFERRGRRVVLSEFGRRLHEATYSAYRHEATAVELLQGARSGYFGLLRIAAVGPYNLAPVLRVFRERWPQVRVAVTMAHSAAVLSRVLDLQDDIGIILRPVVDERIDCRPMRRQRLIVFAPASHELAGRLRLRMKDLDGREFVLREHGSTTREAFERGLSAAGFSVRSSLIMGSREGVREAVAHGLGLGVVAGNAFQSDPRLVVLDIVDLNIETHAHMICRRDHRGRQSIIDFEAAVGSCAGREPAAAPQALPHAPENGRGA